MSYCHECKYGIIDNEYEINVKGVPTLTDALLCGNETLKNLYYNKNAKTKSAMVDASEQPPILVGNAYGYCRGKFHTSCGHSILMSEDDIDGSIYDEINDPNKGEGNELYNIAKLPPEPEYKLEAQSKYRLMQNI